MTVKYLDAKRIQGSSTSTQIQGYAGGLGTYSADYAGGGGGGATTTGFAQDVNSIGGTGIANSITGSEVGQLDSGTYYFSGGGGGGKSGSSNTCLGGLGGGGAGGSTSATDGTVNTGGGGGGHSSTGNAGAGGSGVVLVTYKTSEITDDSSDGSLESGSSIPSGYAIRKFTSSGANTFSISAGSGNVQYVVVAGGGGGGSGGGSGSDYGGGGGGSGGFLTGTKSMSAGDYTVTVGAGGSATNAHGNDGNNSVFDDITSTAGGGGAGSADANKNGNNGGSGGGASRAGTVGTGTSTITDDKATLVIDGKSCFFDGTDDYVTAPATILSGVGTGIFSMAMWIRSDTSSRALIGYSSGNYWEIHRNASAKIEYSSNTNRSGSTVLSNDTWYHLVVQRNGSDIISMWVDGVAQTMSDSTADTVSFSGDVTIGKRGSFWSGYIDDMVITSDLLTASEISDLAGGKTVAQVNPDNQTVHYTFQSDFTDSSGNARNGTATGAVAGSTTSPPAYTYSNLPENTIFNETDTYSQWWLQDGEWIMTPTWSDTFVSNKGWTQVGSQVIDEWATTNLVQYTNARTDWIWKLLPVPIQGGKDWAVRVKWTHTSTSASGGQYALLYLSNSASDPESSGVKSLGVHFAPYVDSIRVRTNDEGTKTYGTGSGGSYEGTDNWIHLYRSGTTLYIQLYADATFTTTRGTLVSIAIPDNIKDIDLTYFSFGADSEDEGTFTGSMDNLEIYNGVAL